MSSIQTRGRRSHTSSATIRLRGQGAANPAIDANRIDWVLDVLAGRILTLEGLTVLAAMRVEHSRRAPVEAHESDVTSL
jgi:hypothetical protein